MHHLLKPDTVFMLFLRNKNIRNLLSLKDINVLTLSEELKFYQCSKNLFFLCNLDVIANHKFLKNAKPIQKPFSLINKLSF